MKEKEYADMSSDLGAEFLKKKLGDGWVSGLRINGIDLGNKVGTACSLLRALLLYCIHEA